MYRGTTLLLALLVAWCAPAVRADTSGQQRAQEAGAQLIGTLAPRLTLKTIDGATIDLARLYGKQAVYLKFWATWCVPCRQQMPHFERVYETAGQDLTVIAIDTGFNDSIDEVRKYRERFGIRMPIVVDDGRAGAAFHLRVTPQHVVIGRDGRIAYMGHLADEKLEAALRSARAMPAVNFDASSAPAAPSTASALPVGAPAPSLEVRTLSGDVVPLRDPEQRQSTVILFMSPWCESYLEKSSPQRSLNCRRAREQTEKLLSTTDARWIGISSGLWATPEDVLEYRKDQKVAMPLALDQTGAVFRAFAVRDVPTIIVIDSSGRVAKRINTIGNDLAMQINLTSRSPTRPR